MAIGVALKKIRDYLGIFFNIGVVVSIPKTFVNFVYVNNIYIQLQGKVISDQFHHLKSYILKVKSFWSSNSAIFLDFLPNFRLRTVFKDSTDNFLPILFNH